MRDRVVTARKRGAEYRGGRTSDKKAAVDTNELEAATMAQM
jgi:hypothetical protein